MTSKYFISQIILHNNNKNITKIPNVKNNDYIQKTKLFNEYIQWKITNFYGNCTEISHIPTITEILQDKYFPYELRNDIEKLYNDYNEHN